MSLLPDNFAALIYLKSQCRKWKNIAYLMIIITFLLGTKLIFSSSDTTNNNLESDISNYIASIKIEGIIFDDDYRTKILKKIAEQKNIKAVIINVDSPGGGVVGSEVLYDNLREIAKNKPIVAVMGAMATSGGYMTSIASDHIIARNGTLTGSIGVIIQSSEFTGMADKLGIKFLTYKSSPLKGAPSPFEKSNPAVERVINESIKDTYEFFSGLVIERRGNKLKKKDLATITDGRIFTGRQALKEGLVDQIGGEKEALAYLKTKQIDTENLPVKEVSIEEPEDGFVSKLVGKESLSKAVAKSLGFKEKSEQIMAIWDIKSYQY